MDFDKCMKILQERQAASSSGCSCCETLATDGQESTDLLTHDFSQESILDLINIFQRMQEGRVLTYTEYDSTLQVLIAEGRIGEYSALCAEVTARFKAISNTIRSLQVLPLLACVIYVDEVWHQNVLSDRAYSNLAGYIEKVQGYERDKIVLVAALHMDLIGEHFPALVEHMGVTRSASNKSYTIDKIRECEEKIASVLEEIQIEKSDIFAEEGEST